MEEPVRTCVACRARRSKRALIRLVVAPDASGQATVTPDPAAREPGRGAYVCPGERCVEALLAGGTRAVARALRADPAAVRVDGEALRAAAARRTQQDEETTATVTAAGRGRPRPRVA